MKRDFELVRKILLQVESTPAGFGPIALEFPDEYDQALVNEHVDLLLQANLIQGKLVRSMQGIIGMAIQGLTWEGHEFLEAAAKDTLWKKALEAAKEKGLALTLDVLKELLKSLALKAAILP
jgi:hypothetical protein